MKHLSSSLTALLIASGMLFASIVHAQFTTNGVVITHAIEIDQPGLQTANYFPGGGGTSDMEYSTFAYSQSHMHDSTCSADINVQVTYTCVGPNTDLTANISGNVSGTSSGLAKFDGTLNGIGNPDKMTFGLWTTNPPPYSSTWALGGLVNVGASAVVNAELYCYAGIFMRRDWQRQISISRSLTLINHPIVRVGRCNVQLSRACYSAGIVRLLRSQINHVQLSKAIGVLYPNFGSMPYLPDHSHPRLA